MILDTFRFLLSILLIYSLGFSWSSIFKLKWDNTYEKFGFSFGLGIATVFFQQSLYSLFKIHWSIASFIIPYFLIFLFPIYRNRKRIYTLKIPRFHFRPFHLIFIIPIVYVFFEACLRPLQSWDGWAQWYLGAKAYFVQRGFMPGIYSYASYDIPPLINFLLSFIFINIGRVNDRLSNILFPLFYISSVFVLIGSLKKHLKPLVLYTVIFIFLTLPNIVRHAGRFDAGNADLPLAYFFLCSTMLLLSYLRNFSRRKLILMNIFVALLALTKNEGLTAFVIVEMICLLFQIKVKKNFDLIFLIIGLIPVCGWWITKFYFHLTASYLEAGHFYFSRIPEIVLGMIQEMLNITRWNIFWPTLIMLIIVSKLNKNSKISLIIVSLQLVAYVLVYALTPLNPIKQLFNSFDRLLIQITPLSIYIFGLTLNKFTRYNNTLNKSVKSYESISLPGKKNTGSSGRGK